MGIHISMSFRGFYHGKKVHNLVQKLNILYFLTSAVAHGKRVSKTSTYIFNQIIYFFNPQHETYVIKLAYLPTNAKNQSTPMTIVTLP